MAQATRESKLLCIVVRTVRDYETKLRPRGECCNAMENAQI